MPCNPVKTRSWRLGNLGYGLVVSCRWLGRVQAQELLRTPALALAFEPADCMLVGVFYDTAWPSPRGEPGALVRSRVNGHTLPVQRSAVQRR